MDSMEQLRLRIRQVLRHHDFSVYKLAKTDSERVKMNNQINQSTGISVETIFAILTTFPDVSAEWLLRGTGEQTLGAPCFNANTNTVTGNSVVTNTNTSSDSALRDENIKLRGQIEILKELLKAKS